MKTSIMLTVATAAALLWASCSNDTNNTANVDESPAQNQSMTVSDSIILPAEIGEASTMAPAEPNRPENAAASPTNSATSGTTANGVSPAIRDNTSTRVGGSRSTRHGLRTATGRNEPEVRSQTIIIDQQSDNGTLEMIRRGSDDQTSHNQESGLNVKPGGTGSGPRGEIQGTDLRHGTSPKSSNGANGNINSTDVLEMKQPEEQKEGGGGK